MQRVLTVALTAAALLAAGAAGRSSAAAQEAADERPLRLSLGVLPFFSTAPTPAEDPAAPDLDGYRSVTAPAKAVGAAALLADLLSRTGKVEGVLVQESTLAAGPLQAQSVILACEHRKAAPPATGWEAFVELAVEVTDTTTGAELETGYYRGVAPARGPLASGVRAEFFKKGIAPFKDRPLGLAFQAALSGVVNGTREEPSQPGLAALAAGITWEARVIKRDGDRYWIDAGSANGLRVGDAFTPYRETPLDEPPLPGKPGDLAEPPSAAPLRTALVGKLQVATLEPHRAVLLPRTGEVFDKTAVVAGVCQGTAVDTRALLSAPNVPPSFLVALQRKLNQFESDSDGAWPRDSVLVTGQGAPQEGKTSVRLKFWDQRRTPRVQIGEWNGIVSEKDGAPRATTCFFESKPTLVAATMAPGVEAPLVKAPGDKVPLPVKHDGDKSLNRLLTNRRNVVRLDLGFADQQVRPKNGVFRNGDELHVRLLSSADGYATIYNFDAKAVLTQVWPFGGPGRPPTAGKVQRGVPVPIDGSVGNNLGQELLIAVVWKDEDAAQELASANPSGLVELSRAIKKISSRTVAAQPVEVEPLQQAIFAVVNRARAGAARVAGGESSVYATAWMEYKTGP